MLVSKALSSILQHRRQQLANFISSPVILFSGKARSRNFPANTYPFRSSSHFLYFAGIPLENAAIHLENGKLTLFFDNPSPSSTLWHGKIPTRDEIATAIGAANAYPFSEISHYSKEAATIPVSDPNTTQQQTELLNRLVNLQHALSGRDLALAKAVITLRLIHDAEALTEIRQAAAVSVQAHKAGMQTTLHAKTEAEIRAAMEEVILAHNMTCAYNSIVTVQGEVLHNEQYHHHIQPGDLLLADVGAETPNGWASDITRTWAVNGQFSPTQADIYDIVLAAHDACIEAIRPGGEYRDIHLLAAKVIAQGLKDLGILKGDTDSLVETDAYALFFPHGIGHLLGLDVHDMEDLGDLAGYAEGRKRSNRFGLCYLRLNRPLQENMVVTIEPGFYQVPGILNDSQTREKYREMVNWDRLHQFADVRGIRIEDDVLITASGQEVLTAVLPTQRDKIEALVQS